VSFEPERALNWWDQLDDLFALLAIRSEHIRRWILVALSTLGFALIFATGVTLALIEPPLALAFAVLLLVVCMYQVVTGRRTLEISA
jgi:hypothetical protein